MPWKLYLRTFAGVICLIGCIAVFGGGPSLVRQWEAQRDRVLNSELLWIGAIFYLTFFYQNWEFERSCNPSGTACIGVMRKWTVDLDSTEHVIVTWDGRNPNSWWWASQDYLYFLDPAGYGPVVTWQDDRLVVLDHRRTDGTIFGCLPTDYEVVFKAHKRFDMTPASAAGFPDRCAAAE